MLAGVSALIVPCIPPGICYGDFGDLQMAGATLGIAHPPGYAVYATLTHLATYVPGLDPMYAVSLSCFAAGLAALLLCALVAIRLRVNAWIASAAVLLVTLKHPVRLNLIAPEVYGWTLFFLAAAVYLVLKFARVRRARDLYLAGLCFGVAVFSRPPVLLAAPFFLGSWLLAASGTLSRWKSLGWLTLAFITPGAYSVGYLLAQDRADASYNYIEHYNADERKLPTLDSGLRGRLERVIWTLSGRQFSEYVRGDAGTIRKKIGWLLWEISPPSTPILIFLLIAAASGGALLYRRSRVALILLLGLIAQSVGFVSIYNVHGQAADIMPLLFSGTVLVSAFLSWAIGGLGRAGRGVAVAVFATAAWWTTAEGLEWGLCRPADAASFAARSRFDSLPADAVVLAAWEESVPLRYAHVFHSDREDVLIVTSPIVHWTRLASRYEPRPVFVSRHAELLKAEFDMILQGTVWRLSRRAGQD
jgi:hypothetical protein